MTGTSTDGRCYLYCDLAGYGVRCPAGESCIGLGFESVGVCMS